MRRRILSALLLAMVLVSALALGGCFDTGKAPAPPKQGVTQPSTTNCPVAPGDGATPAHRRCEGWAQQDVPAPPRLGASDGLLSPGASAPTVDMQDTIFASTITGHPFAVAGYTSGYWPSYFDLLAAHYSWHPRVVSIAVTAGRDADCLDAEPGDADPSQAGRWVRREQSLGHWKPCVYSSISEMYSVRGNLAAWHIGRGEVRLWCAHYTYVAHNEPGCDGTQWTDHLFGKNLDGSTMLASFFGQQVQPGPSHKQIVSAVKSKRFYRDRWNRRNGAGQTCGDHPLQGNCPSYRDGVVAAQDFLEGKAGYAHVHCWGPLRQQSQAVCVVLRPTLAVWSRAAESSWKQWSQRDCAHRRNVGNCHLFRHRGRYFDRRVRQALRNH